MMNKPKEPKNPGETNFMREELAKIIGGAGFKAVYPGTVAYVKLDNELIVKAEFVSETGTGDYNAMKVSVINSQVGLIDSITLFFSDLFANDPCSQPACAPRIGFHEGKLKWKESAPTAQDIDNLVKDFTAFVHFYGDYIDF